MLDDVKTPDQIADIAKSYDALITEHGKEAMEIVDALNGGANLVERLKLCGKFMDITVN